MNRPLLSICIPTYNRATFLPVCLDSIISQLHEAEIRSEVEIVIADNASTDNTSEIVKEYQAKFPEIVYFRNEKNLGFDRSFAKLIEKSTGIYCLSIGDDDAFFDGSIRYLMPYLKKGTVPFFGLNCFGYDYDLVNPVLPYPNLRIDKDLHFKKLSEYIYSIKEYTNLVGIFVGLSTQLFKRDPWVSLKNKEQYFDTLAIHMYVNLSVYKNEPFSVIAKPLIKTRSSNIRWDVFAGLETIQGRIKSTLTIVRWVRDTYSLSIPDWKLLLYFYTREYWFTSKEVAKMLLQKAGLSVILAIYRKLRK